MARASATRSPLRMPSMYSGGARRLCRRCVAVLDSRGTRIPHQNRQDLLGADRYDAPGTENPGRACFEKKVVVLFWYDAPDENENVRAAEPAQLPNRLGHQCL